MTYLLADTPWTFPFWLAWAILSLCAPVILIGAGVLAAFRHTRTVGLHMLTWAAIGSVFGALGDVALMLAVGEHFSQSTISGWLFALGGAFSLFAILAGAAAADRLRRRPV